MSQIYDLKDHLKQMRHLRIAQFQIPETYRRGTGKYGIKKNGDKDIGSEREGYRKWKVLTPLPPSLPPSTHPHLAQQTHST